jgi:hypothetical protein
MNRIGSRTKIEMKSICKDYLYGVLRTEIVIREELQWKGFDGCLGSYWHKNWCCEGNTSERKLSESCIPFGFEYAKC